MSQDAPVTKVWRKNLSIDTGDIVETWKSGMHSVMPWPWTLTFWPQNLISSSLSRGAPVTKVWRKSVNRYWRYRGNIELQRESRTHGRTDGRRHGRTTRKHIASAGAYRRRRLKNSFGRKVAHVTSNSRPSFEVKRLNIKVIRSYYWNRRCAVTCNIRKHSLVTAVVGRLYGGVRR